MRRLLPVTALLIGFTSVSCKNRNDASRQKDAVDSYNPMFGTGRSVGTKSAKRNCFKSGIFSEDQVTAATSASGAPGSDASEKNEASQSSSGIRLIKTKINQMNIQTYVLSTSSKTSSDRKIGGGASASIPAGMLSWLNVSPEFSLKIDNVIEENKKANVDSYLLTVKYLSHAVAIQPDENDFRPDALGLLDGKEASFKRFISGCGDEFLSMKEYGGEITLVFGATHSIQTGRSDTTFDTHVGVNRPKVTGGEAAPAPAPSGPGGSLDVNGGTTTHSIGVSSISNFVMSENALVRSSPVSCTVPRTGDSKTVVYDQPFIPKNKTELDEFIYCLPRWIDAVPISFNYTDYANVFPLSLEQSVIDSYQSSYVAAKKAYSDKLMAEQKAAQEQREREQAAQDALKTDKQPTETVVFEIPKLKTVNGAPGTRPSVNNPNGRQARLDATRKFIKANMVFATPSQCAVAGCDGYSEVSGACTRCQEAVQAVDVSYGGINFCRDSTECREGISCQAAGNSKIGVCR